MTKNYICKWLNYNCRWIAIALFIVVWRWPVAVNAQQTHCSDSLSTSWPMERLDRGAVALPARHGGIFISWRLLGYDAPTVHFDVLRNGKVIARHRRLTNLIDAQGSVSSLYQIVTHQPDKCDTCTVRPWPGAFMRLQLHRPQDGVTPDGQPYTYRPNDCSVGDVDGDGQYELIVKWEPSNARDNAHDGYTGNVLLDCYKLNGQQLWRIDLGCNIRAGAHYTQFLVYDFDGDGHSELMCKTAPGAKDGAGQYVSNAATDSLIRRTDNQVDLRNDRGRILSGGEWLTVFNGLTGRAVHTIWYRPNRGFGISGAADYADWGDRTIIGNRGERYLACAAYLDGPTHPASAVFCRGYYTRSYLWAVDFDGHHLHTRWLHASLSPHTWIVTNEQGDTLRKKTGLKATAYGQGAHSIAVGDVDHDGCDEITYGSAAVDHDGSLLYSTGLGHGDAQHLADLDPDQPGLEYYMVHEAYPYGADLRDAQTGEVLFRQTGREDTGRGLAADIDSLHRGQEMWCSASPQVRDCHGNVIAETWLPMNFRIYWDGDLQDELLGNFGRAPFFPPNLMKWNGSKAVPMSLADGKMLYEEGNSATCNWTKATPCLQADIMGDWREELIFFDKTDPSVLNIFSTAEPTAYRVPTLMHDHLYRMGIVWQNVGYNQPPHVGYYLPDKAEKCKE